MIYTKCHNLLCEDRLTVFLLHGVISSNDYRFRNYNRKHILLKEFDHLLSELTRHGTPITMDQVADYCQNGGFPKNAFAITFDDGFKNNLTNAAPLLIKHNVPATFYLTTSFVDKNLMSWTDRIDFIQQQVAKKTGKDKETQKIREVNGQTGDVNAGVGDAQRQ